MTSKKILNKLKLLQKLKKEINKCKKNKLEIIF